jgi:hypothetical protein
MIIEGGATSESNEKREKMSEENNRENNAKLMDRIGRRNWR